MSLGSRLLGKVIATTIIIFMKDLHYLIDCHSNPMRYVISFSSHE